MDEQDKPVCPESMLHVRDMLIESRFPDWLKEAMADPGHERHRHATRIEPLLRQFAEVDTDHYLSTLHANDYLVTETHWRSHFRYALANHMAMGEVVSKMRGYSTLTDLEVDALINQATDKWHAKAEEWERN